MDELVSLSVTESKEEILRNARYNEDGSLQRVEWDWSRPGHKQSPGMSNTILGNLTIDGGRLTVEVNSANRAKKIRKTIEKRLGAGVRFKLDEITPFRPQEVWEAAQDPDRLEPASHESLMQNPEVQRVLAETMRTHWEGWVDMEIPALGNRTPREAVRTADGREAVEALLLDFERGGPFNRNWTRSTGAAFSGSETCWACLKKDRKMDSPTPPKCLECAKFYRHQPHAGCRVCNDFGLEETFLCDSEPNDPETGPIPLSRLSTPAPPGRDEGGWTADEIEADSSSIPASIPSGFFKIG